MHKSVQKWVILHYTIFSDIIPQMHFFESPSIWYETVQYMFKTYKTDLIPYLNSPCHLLRSSPAWVPYRKVSRCSARQDPLKERVTFNEEETFLIKYVKLNILQKLIITIYCMDVHDCRGIGSVCVCGGGGGGVGQFRQFTIHRF